MNTENNKLIAEFLGKKYKDNYVVIGDWAKCTQNPSGEVWEQCKYHSDWNWLMEVINKLTTLNEFQDYEFKSLFWDTFCQLDIEEVYTQVVLFIKWYNEQK